MLTFLPANMGQFCRRKVPYLNRIGMGVGPVGDYLAILHIGNHWRFNGNMILLCIMLRVALSLSWNLYLVFAREWKPLKIVLFRLSVDLTSGGSLQLEQTGINCYYVHNYGQCIGLYRDVWIAAIAWSRTSLATQTAAVIWRVCFSAATCTLSHTTCHLYVDVALFYYDVTRNYVLWTEGVSEINYWIELNWILVIHRRFNGITLATDWWFNGNTLAPLWWLNGNTLATHWRFNGNSLEIKWPHIGNSLAIQWQLVGDYMATHWQLIGDSMATRWRLPGNTLTNHWRFNGISLVIQWKHIGNSSAFNWQRIGNSLAIQW